MDLFDLAVKLKYDDSEVDKGMDETYSNAEKFGAKLGTTMGKAITTITATSVAVASAAGTAIIKIGKQAIENFGEYQQLAGGVEAIFGGMEQGADKIIKVQNTAKDAWKDLTMSQNDYFQSFTSTYPLMKADIEDENEAIDATNRLLTLNSDLANTFGYDIETASNAVNWALKGSFNYLDNLGIGIKGTQEGFLEAARNVGYMVDNVSELSSSDILDILEKTADQYGVLGRTGEEASRTIQGSIKSMRASWENLLTGMADDTQDFDSLLTNFIDSVGTVGENLIPRVEIVLVKVVDLVNGLIPKISDSLPGLIENLTPPLMEAIISLGGAITDALPVIVTTVVPSLIETALNLVITLTESILTMLPTLLQTGIELINSLILGLAETIPELIPVAVECIMQLANTLTNNSNLLTLINSALILIDALANGIISSLPILLETAPELINNLVSAILLLLPTILQAGARIIVSLSGALISNLPSIVSSALLIIPKFIGAIMQNIGQLASVGKNIVDGVWKGIKNNYSNFMANVKNFFKNIVDGVKKSLGIHSPSKVFAGIGEFMAMGLDEGFSDEMNNVKKDIEKTLDFGSQTITGAYNISSDSGSAQSLIGGNNIVMNVYGAVGQDVSKLADEIEERLANKMYRSGKVYG